MVFVLQVQKMGSLNVFVKRLSKCEVMGSCTTICTDKTGTLTQNKMQVRIILKSLSHLRLLECVEVVSEGGTGGLVLKKQY